MSKTSLESSESTSLPLKKKNLSWWKYLGLGIFSNAAVWGLVYAYLNFLPPTYTSEFAILILGQEPDLNISLANVGSASQATSSNRPNEYEDPRGDYIYLANSADVLSKAAELMEMDLDEFGEPEITEESDSALIAFIFEGDTPEEAQKKSQLIYELLVKKIDALKQEEIERRQKKTEKTLKEARQKLNEAEKKVAIYQANSNFNSDSQITNLSTNIEELRGDLARLIAEEQQLTQKLQSLFDSTGVSDSEARKVFTLQADNFYQQQLEKYGQISNEFANLSSKLGLQHPQVVEKKVELEETLKLLIDRASFLLDQNVTQKTLIKLNALALDPKLQVIRQDLFKEIFTTNSELQGISAEKKEIEKQIIILEGRLQDLSNKQLSLNNLTVDLELARAIFTETVAKLDLGPEDIDSIYPPVQLVLRPTLADEDEPISPDEDIGLLAGIGGSFLVTTGLILLWWERRNNFGKSPKNLILTEKEETK